MSADQDALPTEDGEEGTYDERAKQIDRYVGSRIRDRRILQGLTQQQLAQLIGVTYQQAHKYERGLNRVSAGRLYQIATVFDVSPSWFFDGLEGAIDEAAAPARHRMVLELVRNFRVIENVRQQEALCQMARVLAARSMNDGSGRAKLEPAHH